MLYPFTFKPIFKERIWGGRTLERLYGKRLPSNLPVGESWEISDRPGDVSVVDNGPLAGCNLHALLTENREALLGNARLVNGRFPLLIKILDAREKLSLQVHPPASVAERLKGEPKTEMWYLAEADSGAELFAGLRRGISRSEFEDKLRTAAVAECFHRIPVRAGDAMFVPSGRVHAIGAGCTIFEVQENSDTTYRVFDWNRVGPDGQARELHIAQSLESIDFTDFEPGLIPREIERSANGEARFLVSNELFDVQWLRMVPSATQKIAQEEAIILGMLCGELRIQGNSPVDLVPGRFCMIPASMPAVTLEASARCAAEFLVIRPK